MAKLMDQGSGTVVGKQGIGLLKVAGQSNDWGLVFAIAQLPATAQCEVCSLWKLPRPAEPTSVCYMGQDSASVV